MNSGLLRNEHGLMAFRILKINFSIRHLPIYKSSKGCAVKSCAAFSVLPPERFLQYNDTLSTKQRIDN